MSTGAAGIRTASIGTASDRVDGGLKVTGGARYAADHSAAQLAYAAPVVSTIAKGRVVSIDSRAAERAPGVLAIITRDNCPRLNRTSNDFGSWTKLGELRLPFEDDRVHYAGQYVALVVADTIERAAAAAAMVKVEYAEEAPQVETSYAEGALFVPKDDEFGSAQVKRGSVAKGIKAAEHRIEQQYTTPIEHHNPMEPSATTAVWNGDDLTLYDATQWVMGARNCVADVLGMDRERVRIVSEFVGGGFGCKGFTWAHQPLAAVAAKMAGRPVKLALSRQMMFSACGHRPETRQHVVLAADRDGKLTAIRHDSVSQTSSADSYIEKCGVTTPYLYACPNVEVTHKLSVVNIATPTAMRAPGENPGLFAIESALDELAHLAGIDPVELRLRNYAKNDQQKKLPFSSKHLQECYELGRERIGWKDRSAKPGCIQDGRALIGYGMATATYPGYRFQGAAVARLHDDGAASVASATQDIGSGTYTVMVQVAADSLGLPVTKVTASLGDSRLPPAPVSGGSMTVASVAPAVKAACEAVLEKLAHIAVTDDESPFHDLESDSLVAENGSLRTKDGKISRTYAEVLRSRKLSRIEAESRVQPGDEQRKYSFHSFGAQFAKVRVDPGLGQVRIEHLVGVFDAGRVINPKTARSQMLGGMIQGIGMALMEQTLYDKRNGRIVTDNLADYLVPVHADIHNIEPLFLNIPDPYINSVGARGVGELAVTGVAPAIANAVFNATGKRIRDLPITIEKLM